MDGGAPSQIPGSRTSRRHRGALRSAGAVAVVLLGALGSCGSSSGPAINESTGPAQELFSSSEPADPACARIVVAELQAIAEHVYTEGDGGRIAQQAVARLERSPLLRIAVEHKDPAAAHLALQRLQEKQIVRSRVMVGSRTLADFGNKDAIAPVSGVIKSTTGQRIATFDISVLGGKGYAATLVGLIGAKTVISAGSREFGSTLKHSANLHLPASGPFKHDGITFQTVSFPLQAFSGRTAHAHVLFESPSASLCATSPAQTSTNTIGAVGERIYLQELTGGKTREAIRTAEHSGPFRRAVATGNLTATRAAIIGFFANRSHVVRVRVYRSGKLFLDVGGPHVLAPATGHLSGPNGRRIGTFQLAIQDDRGYVHLAHNFTGADVLLRSGTTVLSGTLEPGPESIPARGRLTYRGSLYQAFSFDGEAFPSGPLRISLLVKQP